MNIGRLVLLVLALVLFLMAGLNIPARGYNLVAWGLFCLALAQLVPTI